MKSPEEHLHACERNLIRAAAAMEAEDVALASVNVQMAGVQATLALMARLERALSALSALGVQV